MPKLKYHHIGLPTDRDLPQQDYVPTYKKYASGYLEVMDGTFGEKEDLR